MGDVGLDRLLLGLFMRDGPETLVTCEPAPVVALYGTLFARNMLALALCAARVSLFSICSIDARRIIVGAQQKATELGINLDKLEKGYLNLCAKTGNLLITSGHVSDLKGKLGAGLSVEEGYKAARDCAEKILRSVHNVHGSLDGLRVIKLLGCVNSTLEFTDQHLVINGASDLLHELYGKEGDGYHARSALGFAALPTNAAVEVEAIFEIL